MILKSGNLVAGITPKPLLTVNTLARSIDILSHSSNGGSIYIGGFETCAETDREKGWLLSPGDVFSLKLETIDDLNLAEIFVAANNPGDYISWGALLIVQEV